MVRPSSCREIDFNVDIVSPAVLRFGIKYMSDILYLTIALLFLLFSLGLVAVCQRLLEN
jgi:hypothetical protein